MKTVIKTLAFKLGTYLINLGTRIEAGEVKITPLTKEEHDLRMLQASKKPGPRIDPFFNEFKSQRDKKAIKK